MYRYLVFAYLDYYPRGGMEDCIYKSNDLDHVKDFVREYIKNNIDDFNEINYYDCQEGVFYEADYNVEENKYVSENLIK